MVEKWQPAVRLHTFGSAKNGVKAIMDDLGFVLQPNSGDCWWARAHGDNFQALRIVNWALNTKPGHHLFVAVVPDGARLADEAASTGLSSGAEKYWLAIPYDLPWWQIGRRFYEAVVPLLDHGDESRVIGDPEPETLAFISCSDCGVLDKNRRAFEHTAAVLDAIVAAYPVYDKPTLAVN